MKTAIEEAIKEIRKMTDDKEVTFNFGLTTAIEILKNKLPKEREQIESAFNQGMNFSEDYFEPNSNLTESQNYYETTFKKIDYEFRETI